MICSLCDNTLSLGSVVKVGLRFVHVGCYEEVRYTCYLCKEKLTSLVGVTFKDARRYHTTCLKEHPMSKVTVSAPKCVICATPVAPDEFYVGESGVTHRNCHMRHAMAKAVQNMDKFEMRTITTVDSSDTENEAITLGELMPGVDLTTVEVDVGSYCVEFSASELIVYAIEMKTGALGTVSERLNGVSLFTPCDKRDGETRMVLEESLYFNEAQP